MSLFLDPRRAKASGHLLLLRIVNRGEVPVPVLLIARSGTPGAVPHDFHDPPVEDAEKDDRLSGPPQILGRIAEVLAARAVHPLALLQALGVIAADPGAKVALPLVLLPVPDAIIVDRAEKDDRLLDFLALGPATGVLAPGDLNLAGEVRHRDRAVLVQVSSNIGNRILICYKFHA